MNFALILFVLTVADRRRSRSPTGWFCANGAARGARRAVVDRISEELLSGAADRVPAALLRRGAVQDSQLVDAARRSEVGDFILVNKFAYGIRLPIIEEEGHRRPVNPQRGDVIVFRYPVNPSQDFIKRVDRACPAIEVVYLRQAADGQRRCRCRRTRDGTYGYLEGLTYVTTERLSERSGNREYTIAVNPAAQPVYPLNVRSFPGKENCVYNDRGFTCKVSPGQLSDDGRQPRQQRRQPLLGLRAR